MLRLFSLIAAMALVLADGLAAEAVPAQRTVLITGASSGIGRLTTEHLAKAGYLVYAGARSDADIAELSAIENVKALRLDVTDQLQIDAAVEQVRREGRGLWGLVNNAGINIVGSTIEFPDEDFELLFDVNVAGVFRVTKAFAPLIIESMGRIVNVSSISGFGTSEVSTVYAMTKHATEAFTDGLAKSMARLEVPVTAVVPGNYRSEIGMTRCKRMLANEGAYRSNYFPDMTEYLLADCRERIATGVSSTAPSPEAVAQAIEHALSSERPKERYLVVPDREDAEWPIRTLIRELAVLNHDHEFSFSREQLVEWLDQELGRLNAPAEPEAEGTP